jgi:hypothetical protein
MAVTIKMPVCGHEDRHVELVVNKRKVRVCETCAWVFLLQLNTYFHPKEIDGQYHVQGRFPGL